MKMDILFKRKLIFKIAFITTVIYPSVVFAALTLPTVPLVTSESIDPNMMLFIDSSGSMSFIVEDSDKYDPDTYTYTCNNAKQLNVDVNKSVRLIIDISNSNNPKALFSYNQVGLNSFGTTYDFGSGSTGITNRTEMCFDNDATYRAVLNAGSSTNGYYYAPTGHDGAQYPGKFLNWYFENATSNFTPGARKRDDTQTRIEVAKDAATTLIDDLENIRVGLSIFGTSGSDGNGVKILANIEDVDTSSVKDNLRKEIKDITATGGTPIAESMQELARYFTLGTSSNNYVNIHPDGANTSVKIKDLFKKSPQYSGVQAPKEVTTEWCQQSFIVAMTDGLPSGDISNISTYLQDYDNDCSPSGKCDSYDRKKVDYSYSGSGGSDYADDIIKAMYDIDLRPDLPEAKNNVTTYMVGFAENSLKDDFFMRDMAAAGGGGALLSAANSDELTAAFREATKSIFARTAAGSGVTFDSGNITAGNAAYSATFNSAKWSGNLQAFAIDNNGNLSPTEIWDGAIKLDSTIYTSRNIFTFNDDSNKGTVFGSNLSNKQLNDLKKGPGGAAGSDDLIKYLKGDRTLEGSDINYRIRDSALGDIVNSTVVYVGAPDSNWPSYDATAAVKFGSSTNNYENYKIDNATRKEMLYVGANDGMLHAFNADEANGEIGLEEFAYIPGLVSSSEDKEGLHYLAQTDYEHRFYVDLTPTVSDVYINNQWRTILVGGLRAGGKGLFALDITDPSNFSETTANAEALSLWEFSHPNFGYSYSKPTIAMMANGKWAVIVGNGYNNSGDGKAKLFILYIEEGQDGNWVSSTDYIEIDTGVGSTGKINGLSTPHVVDIDGDSIIDRIYAGDLEGNMWAFDVTSTNSNDWDVTTKLGSTPEPLFVARDGANNRQPITAAPAIAAHSIPTDSSFAASNNEPNLLVLFGTGKYLEEVDRTATDTMSYYAVWDQGEGSKVRSDLTERKVVTVDDNTRGISGGVIDWTTSSGWYFDLVDRATSTANTTELGERVITSSFVSNEILVFTTVIPYLANSNVCAANSKSWIMGLDFLTGLAPVSFTIFDTNNDGKFDDLDKTPTEDTNGDGVIDANDSTNNNTGVIGTSSINGVVSDVTLSNQDQGKEHFTLIPEQNTEGSVIKISGVDDTGKYFDQDAQNGGNSIRTGRLSWEELIRP